MKYIISWLIGVIVGCAVGAWGMLRVMARLSTLEAALDRYLEWRRDGLEEWADATVGEYHGL